MNCTTELLNKKALRDEGFLVGHRSLNAKGQESALPLLYSTLHMVEATERHADVAKAYRIPATRWTNLSATEVEVARVARIIGATRPIGGLITRPANLAACVPVINLVIVDNSCHSATYKEQRKMQKNIMAVLAK